MHEETYCGRPITHVATHGVMEVYSIPSYRSMDCPKYVVFHRSGLVLNTPRLKRDALRWALKNKNRQ